MPDIRRWTMSPDASVIRTPSRVSTAHAAARRGPEKQPRRAAPSSAASPARSGAAKAVGTSGSRSLRSPGPGSRATERRERPAVRRRSPTAARRSAPARRGWAARPALRPSGPATVRRAGSRRSPRSRRRSRAPSALSARHRLDDVGRADAGAGDPRETSRSAPAAVLALSGVATASAPSARAVRAPTTSPRSTVPVSSAMSGRSPSPSVETSASSRCSATQRRIRSASVGGDGLGVDRHEASVRPSADHRRPEPARARR